MLHARENHVFVFSVCYHLTNAELCVCDIMHACNKCFLTFSLTSYFRRKSGRDLTQSYDLKPFINRIFITRKATTETRFRKLWLHNDCGPTYEDLVYLEYFKCIIWTTFLCKICCFWKYFHKYSFVFISKGSNWNCNALCNNLYKQNIYFIKIL